MFKKVLVANRGEVALRIIRACRELGVKSIAAHSEADTDSLATRLADEKVCIGPAPAAQSYLSIPNIIAAAEVSGADAIHPGYGFLAESAKFAEVCQSCDIKFIGPSAEVISKMGDKSAAKEHMIKAGLPVVPGSEGPIKGDKEAAELAASIGFPVIVKAVSGGGGRGMRIALDADELMQFLPIAKAEAQGAFGDPRVYLEKFITNPRHIEVQILGDHHGNMIHLGERDCSIQRRHQKLIEESPSPAIGVDKRAWLGELAAKAAAGVGYTNAGTIEFLLGEDGSFYFMEMNTRIQVEHPVTEMVTGIDLVKEQIKIAADLPLDIKQSDIGVNGHAIEFRINAEDPENNFMPGGGRVTLYNPPGGPGVRVDSHLYTGYFVPSNYDSLLGKLIVWGRDRDEAIARASRALDEFIIVGLKTTIGFHLEVLNDRSFKEGKFSTGFLESMVLSGAK
ncbi:MAG TPA: acetyl-CoA carboxylase biotin carboxylase subunit [Actinobacteria bacterium]|nr:acetyl-CoA carboxylase biotin carboxylase subunit [Actinomycetota bacterium]